MNRECGCERGGDCTKTTVCAIGSALDDQADELERLRELEDRVKNGFQGGCWCCEMVAMKNIELKALLDEIKAEIVVWYKYDYSNLQATEFMDAGQCADRIKEILEKK